MRKILLFLFILAACGRADVFAPENVHAWCIVPFDAKQRTPAERAEMVARLGIKRVAYDWREKHVAEFEDEIRQYQKHGIEFFAFWGEHPKAFELFAKHGLRPQIWIMAHEPKAAVQEEKVRLAAVALLPLVEKTRALGCKLAIYNHGGWAGEPENMAAIAAHLRANHDAAHAGIVYNFHHGHAHIADFATKWRAMQPFLFAVNLNGMEVGGDSRGRKILHLGEGDREAEMLRVIAASGWNGPVGVIDHRDETDSEITVRNNLRGLAWLRKELAQPGSGGARPVAENGVVKMTAQPAATGTPKLVPGKFGKALDASAGLLLPGDDAWRTVPLTVEAWVKLRSPAPFNVIVASDTKASGAHWELYSYAGAGDFSVYLPGRAGEVRSGRAICDGAWHHVAMILESTRVRLFVDGALVKEHAVEKRTRDIVAGELAIGRTIEPGIGCAGLVDDVRISRGVREVSVPAAPLVRDEATLFLFDGESLPKPPAAAALPEREPLNPAANPLHTEHVNRDRIYDFYAKQARDWRKHPRDLMPAYPGLDGGKLGHWGNQNEVTWRSGKWNEMNLGPSMAGVFRDGKLTVPKAVVVRLEGAGDFTACYDPGTDEWRAVWQGGFVNFSDFRHGLLHGLAVKGMRRTDVALPPRGVGGKYRGYYRHGAKTIFAVEKDGGESLRVLREDGGRLIEESGDALREFTKGGPANWPQTLETKGVRGAEIPGWPFAVDTLTLPFENPWKTLFFLAGHDFFANGDIAVCTMTGDVWRVSGVDDPLAKLRWKRMAAGLHQPLGLVVVDGKVCVLGRDQITRLHDLNADGEADFYECLTNEFTTPTGGHDYLCGLERDALGNFFTVSGTSGLLRIFPGLKTEILASGFRNPDGFGLGPDGTLTVPYSEGEWTPTSAIAQITPGGYYGYPGPKPGVSTLPPLLWLPRGLDNSAGGQTWVPSGKWGALAGQMVHLSYGTGTAMVVLREQVRGVWQGAAVPLPGDFRSGVHRGRFSPNDGQLYVTGMTGWGTYTPDGGCLQRLRHTGGALQMPVAFEARDNGLLLAFSDKLDASAAAADTNFAQCWNYRYSASYGSPELSLRQPGKPGHDVLEITSARVLADGRRLFLEIPQLQPAHQIHIVVRPQPGVQRELFVTAHNLGAPFTEFPGYKPVAKTNPHSAHTVAATPPAQPVKWEQGEAGRALKITTAAGLQFAQKELRTRASERLSLTLENPDNMPHNWVLLRPGTVEKFGALANTFITAPDALQRHYVPASDDVLVHTRVVEPEKTTTIHFTAPAQPGRYPYVCTFPGHWAVMQGVLVVE